MTLYHLVFELQCIHNSKNLVSKIMNVVAFMVRYIGAPVDFEELKLRYRCSTLFNRICSLI